MVGASTDKVGPVSPEVQKKYGAVVVITGGSGSGKDEVIKRIINNSYGFDSTILITMADRQIRAGEADGVDYIFVTPEEMDEAHKRGELVEEPVPTGTSRKATPRSGFDKIFEGQNVAWRIDISRAASVADGTFFDEQFDPQMAAILKQRTIVIFIAADIKSLPLRRMKRDGDRYDPQEYELRDAQEKELMDRVGHLFTNVVMNLDNQLEQTMEQVFAIINQFSS